MFKGKLTQQRYEECLKRGLCEEHIKDINQNDLAALKNEFPKKAFRYIRINILYPLLFKKTPKCPKIKVIMEKTPAFSKILLGENISEAVDIMIILDSVVVFTLCELSKICCIGALFHMKKKINCEDPKLKPLRALLLVDQLDKNIMLYLYNSLQKNFTGCDTDIIKASHVITLIFVRNFCNKFTMKTAFENIEKDILGDTGWEDFKNSADVFYKNKDYTRALDLYTSALLKNFYSSKLYVQVANCNFKLFKFKPTQFYSYLAVTMDSTCSEAYLFLTSCLYYGKQYHEALQIASYGLKVAEKSKHYEKLKTIHSKIENIISKSNSDASKLTSEKPQSMEVKLIDSDSAGSEEELSNSEKPIELINSEDSDDEASVEKMPQLSVKERTKNKLPNATKKRRSLSECSADSSLERDMDITKINSLLKEASEALVADCGYKAVQIFRGPLRDFIESSKFQSFEECDIVCIKYSHGIAYCKSGGYEDLHKCIVILKDILEKHDSITFPAAHYSLGLAYRKLNRFKESLHYLEIIKSFLEKGIHFKVYPWPGVTAVIQETKPDILKNLVDKLMQECENPPNPDAYCRYEKCDYQPTIYYTDPDFKGYISLSCSEQCFMQYHLQCWKVMKAEKELIDKDFLEKPCFTPDCDGVIIKIQNIDKKGDLSKEFISDFKKNPKQKWAKWEKKSEIKDKKRKRHHSKSEEINNEPERKNGFCFAAENANKSENVHEKAEKVKEINADSLQNGICSSSENSDIILDAVDVENELNGGRNQMQSTQSELMLNKCMKENVYSFMADFLLRHGPLKVDDPLLADEMASFPKETLAMIENCHGIGEFLKNNLKFAYVGDIYICHVNDVATAYKMCSNSSLPKALQSLNGSTDSSKYYSEYSSEPTSHGLGLNPNALEYTPVISAGASQDSLFKAKNLNPHISAFRPRTFEASSSSVDKGSSPRANSVSGSEVHLNKSKSYELFSAGTFQMAEPTSSGASSSPPIKKSFSDDAGSGDCTLESDCSNPMNSDLCGNSTNGGQSRISHENACDSRAEFNKLETQLLPLLKRYHSDEMKSHRESIDAYIKPYIIKQLPELRTMTEHREHGTVSPSKSSENSLKAELNRLSEENAALKKDLDCATRKRFELRVKVTQLQQCLEEKELENEKYEKRQQELLEEKKILNKSLTDCKASFDELKKNFASQTYVKYSLQENIDNLTLSHKTMEDKNNALEEKEKKLESTIKDLLKENLGLKKRAKNAELQVLTLKKTEYLKKIGDKSAEASRRRKELTDGLSMISSNLNPVLQNNMKALSDQLFSYVTNLTKRRMEFEKKIDKEIELVTNETPLNEVKEFEMEELPEIPSWTNSFSTNGPTLDKHPFFPNQSPFNLGMSLAMPTQIPPGIYNPPLATSAAVISGSQVLPSANSSTNVPPAISSVAPLSTATIVPPLTAPSVSGFIKNCEIDHSNGSLDFTNLNPQIEESFKSGMASINSFASAPYPAPPLDDEFQKKCVVFKHADPVLSSKPDVPKVPPGIKISVIPSTSAVPAVTKQPSESTAKPVCSNPSNSLEHDAGKMKSGVNLFIAQLDKQIDNAYLKKEFSKFGNILIADVAKDENGESKGYGFVDFSSAKDGLAAMKEMDGKPILGKTIRIELANNQREGSQDALPKSKMDSSRSNLEHEKKKSASGSKSNYEKLFLKLKEHFPEYNHEQLISFVVEFRAQRQGKLSGLPMDKIISEISDIIQTKKLNERRKLSQPKSTKVLVNKKLVPDPKPPTATDESQAEKKKTAWCTVESKSRRRFSGNIEDDCPICYEPMTNLTAHKVACGHAFHEQCIYKWLKTKSDCPVCRVLLLLPEEYPSLS